jgi:phosphoribosylformimino-5-aminoimidazole carboxamide ribotide isomerase
VKFIPAIDLKDNKCVRLEKGKKDKLTIFNDNPLEQAKFFARKGCERIHIVDLDGAFGRKDINKETILKIREGVQIQIELGGGIKDGDDISFWLKEGIDFLIVGSLAAKKQDYIFNISKEFKEKIYVALDILDYKIMIKGWTEDSDIHVNDIINFYNPSLIKGFILTDISRDGMLQGLDIDLIKTLINKTQKKVIVGGGLSNYDDLHNLKNIYKKNLEGVIAGKSFYSGNIEIKKAIKLIKSNA